MVVPANTVTEFSTVGTREDLADIIYNIAPYETPFYNSISVKAKAKQVYHEWQIDNLDPVQRNRVIEGDDASANTFTPTKRLGNYCQISQKTVAVSGTVRASDHAGRADELSYQITRRGRELKRDIEAALIGGPQGMTPQASSAGGTGTARSLASVESWIKTNKESAAADAVAATTQGFLNGTVIAPVDATVPGAFTKAKLDAVIAKCWAEGGAPDTIMVGPYNRQKFSTFTGVSALQTNASDTGKVTMVGSIDMYKSDFGIFKVVPNRFSRDRTALILDMDYWAVANLRGLTMYPLAKTGDSEKRQMIQEYTLVSKNEAASGKVTDLTVTG